MLRTYTNYPTRMILSDYEKACNAIRDKFSDVPNVHSIYQYGSISSPGLSDLDIAIVLDDVVSSSTPQLVQKQYLPRNVLNIMDYATLMIFPKKKFEKITLWDDIHLTPICGQAISLGKVRNQYIEVARIVDWLPERIVRVEELLISEVIDVRKTLGLLKSCTYTLEKVSKLAKQTDNRSEVIKRFAALRSDWFDLKESTQIEHLWYFIHAIRHELYISLRVFGDWWNRNILPKCQAQASTGFLSFAGKFTYSFQNIKAGDEFATITDSKIVNLALPAFYSSHFIHYSGGEGAISNQISRHLKVSSKSSILPNDMCVVLDSRIELVNFWSDWLISNHFKTGIFKFGWFLDDAKQFYYDRHNRSK